MAADKSMKRYECILEDETFRGNVPTDPVCGNAKIGSVVVVGPYISCKRNPADGMLVFQVSYHRRYLRIMMTKHTERSFFRI
jgi:hypothetical protein